MDGEHLDDSGLSALVEEMDGSDLNRVLSLLSFKTGGTVPVRRRALLSFLHGPKSRRRRNWLAAALRVGFELAMGVDDELDDVQLAEHNVSGATVLVDLREQLAGVPHLHSVLPSYLLPDLDMEVDTYKNPVAYSFSLPKGFRWPSASDVSRFLGGDVSSSGSDFADRLDVLERNQRDMPANVKQSIARDVAEHRFAVAGDGSVGTLRKTLAFSMDAEHFYLYSHVLDVGGERDLLLEQPDRGRFFKTLFESSLASKDVSRIERRCMVPTDYWMQAPKFDSKQLAALSSAQTQQYEQLRIKQATALKKSQATVKALASASSCFARTESLLESLGGDEGESDDDDSGLKSDLELLLSDLRGVLHAGSDAFHLCGVELSEWERQKDDIYLRAVSGNPSISVERPIDDDTVLFKNTAKLDTMASAERSRLKDLKVLRGSQPTRQPQKPGTRQQKPKPGAKISEAEKRKQQSERDKRAAAAAKRKNEDEEKKPKPNKRAKNEPAAADP